MEEEKKIEEQKNNTEECEKLKEEYLNGWKRAKADLLNYKKEEAERIQSFAGLLEEEFISSILPVLDSFERAEKDIPEEKKEDQYCKGLLQIKKLFEDFLRTRGVEEMKAVGEKFNPGLHEAESVVEAEGFLKDTVTEVVKKGYLIRGKLLRPAKVKVAK